VSNFDVKEIYTYLDQKVVRGKRKTVRKYTYPVPSGVPELRQRLKAIFGKSFRGYKSKQLLQYIIAISRDKQSIGLY